MVEQEVITEDEAALYDRQIRLWGLDAQRRLRASKVLLVGMKGLGAEVAKNIVLAGIKSLTLLDHREVTEEDSCSQFLVSRSDIGKNTAACSLPKTQQLNPMVDVSADSEDVATKPDEYFAAFDVICVTCCPPVVLKRINKICAENKSKFFAGDVFGYYGYMFSDLGDHEYAEEIPKPKRKIENTEGGGEPAANTEDGGEPAAKKAKAEEPETVVVKKSIAFTRLQCALEYDWSTAQAEKKLKKTPNTYFIISVLLQFLEQTGHHPSAKSKAEDKEKLMTMKSDVLKGLRVKSDNEILSDEFTEYCYAELSPVCAVVGGVLGQEIIKAVSQKDTPHNNFFFYNGVDGSGLVDNIGS